MHSEVPSSIDVLRFHQQKEGLSLAYKFVCEGRTRGRGLGQIWWRREKAERF